MQVGIAAIKDYRCKRTERYRSADTRLDASVSVSNQVKSASRSFELLQKAWLNFPHNYRMACRLEGQPSSAEGFVALPR